ncbi:universal stress protein [Enterococcus xiangfangensis]|uniref:universal stress protein n=1 Tax=Enterococcus xiangfangensis TaxID=1296537 RepID=UPI0010F6B599|nr:universal stress protein [Enterococcus xiangfangensis]MBM7711014.1 nucleotide-binding universal stress UspA family protein [Enterococcus xiangfangensis]
MKESYQKILVAVDSSDQARRAFQEAIEVTRRNHAHLYILMVSDTNRLGAEPYAVDHVIKEMHKASSAVIESLEKSIPEDIAYTSVMNEGNPKAEIVTYAEEQGIDLILMGATGTGTFSRLLLGSTTAYVVNNALCNVMVVR